MVCDMHDQALPGALRMTVVHYLPSNNNPQQVERQDRRNLSSPCTRYLRDGFIQHDLPRCKTKLENAG
jgi:hypothetical protein